MRISFSILAFTSFLALTKAASVEDKIETVALPPKVQVVKADLQKAAQDSIKREVSEVSERYGGYDYEYQRCASQNEDTLCSPSNAYTLGRTFDLLFKGKDGYYQTTDYVELAFVDTRNYGRVSINSQYGRKVRGDRSLIEADNIYIPCGVRGQYYLSVVDYFVDNDNDNGYYRDTEETWWGPYNVNTGC